MFSRYKEIIKEENFGFPRVSFLQRFYLLPIFFIWWCIQLLVYSICGGAFILMLGVPTLLLEFGKKKEDRNWGDSFHFISVPFIYPFIWWIRYFKFGEYNSLD